MVWCLRKEEVKRVLPRYHDLHGHYSEGLMMKKLLGRYYWVSQHQDVREYCRTCEPCQRLGPVRAVGLRPVLSLMPMDLMGLDYIGPISPASMNGSKYILLGIDYFS
ncbi:hypothetical protein DFH27DRAFT_481061 [Peziza echinospora]|nr:hypothetical protein DFH27DRAFT_481061 [Peziza echinospora]